MQRPQFAAHHLPKLGVQRAERLVEQKRHRLADDGPAQRNALAVAARKSGNRAVQQVFDPQDARRLLDPSLDVARQHALGSEWKRDIAAHVHVRIQREQLKHEGDVALRCALEGHVLATQQDAARRRQLEARDHPQRRRLAAARRAEQTEEFAVVNGKRRVPHGDKIRERLVEMLDADPGHRLTPETSIRR